MSNRRGRRRRLSPGETEAVEHAYSDALDYATRQGDADPDRFARRYAGLVRWSLITSRDIQSLADFYAEHHN
ncbi:hypothetical protein FOS14_18155 [Skermania sp. ID1734]|uniref:hypothetical protein n=1 Tax=Skermania sp. ID1734 TaxID=2597516 RepID=UPI00117FEDFF|nr:hypothetical protein [Skermania sp. ID1734]TSD95288.1 hypothetical protein FOS14_18155 [Skermania sp. ID1734]